MIIRLHARAQARLEERGATEEEVSMTVQHGETFPAKFGRVGFRRNFHYNHNWRGRSFATKQVEAIAVREGNDWLVITVVVKFY